MRKEAACSEIEEGIEKVPVAIREHTISYSVHNGVVLVAGVL